VGRALSLCSHQKKLDEVYILNSTQRASADAGDKHLNFHNFLTVNTQIQTFIMLVCPHRSSGNTVDIWMKYSSTDNISCWALAFLSFAYTILCLVTHSISFVE